MSQMTELASGAITQSTPSQSKLGEADEAPAIVIVGWPAKASVSHPCRSVWRGYCCPRLRRRRCEAGAASTGATAVSRTTE
jgi:hypothetical protein